MSGRRYPNRALAFRRLVLTTSGSPSRQLRLVDRCWGSGESREDDPRWPRVPKWLAPVGAFSYAGVTVRLPRTNRVFVVGWITGRRALDEALVDEVRGSLAA